MKYSPAPSSSLWLYPMRGSSDDKNKFALPLLPREPPTLQSATVGDFRNTTVTTSTLTLLDLRGSQRLTDRGLLQLSHPPLRSLEVARLDNCHGITGRGLLAFSQSHRLHTLSLANCRRLTDEAIVNVGHLGASLMALNLGGCRCLTSLEALSGLTSLRKLDLSQVNFL
jgi:hypothetical protein